MPIIDEITAMASLIIPPIENTNILYTKTKGEVMSMLFRIVWEFGNEVKSVFKARPAIIYRE